MLSGGRATLCQIVIAMQNALRARWYIFWRQMRVANDKSAKPRKPLWLYDRMYYLLMLSHQLVNNKSIKMNAVRESVANLV